MAGGRSSGDVCRELGLPKQTVGHWRADHPDFRAAYVEAFRSRCYGFGEEALEIIDSIPPNADMARVQREKARADMRRWAASRLVAAFADQVEHRLTGQAQIQIFLPEKGSYDRPQVIDGAAVEVLEDGSDNRS
jgi:hypothetical protein